MIFITDLNAPEWDRSGLALVRTGPHKFMFI